MNPAHCIPASTLALLLFVLKGRSACWNPTVGQASAPTAPRRLANQSNPCRVPKSFAPTLARPQIAVRIPKRVSWYQLTRFGIRTAICGRARVGAKDLGTRHGFDWFASRRGAVGALACPTVGFQHALRPFRTKSNKARVDAGIQWAGFINEFHQVGGHARGSEGQENGDNELHGILAC